MRKLLLLPLLLLLLLPLTLADQRSYYEFSYNFSDSWPLNGTQDLTNTSTSFSTNYPSYNVTLNGTNASAEFDGSASVLLRSGDNIAITSEFTTSMWVYPHSFGGNQFIMEQGDTTASDRSMDIFLDATGDVHFDWADPSSATTWECQYTTSSTPLSENAWNHIAIVKNSTNSTLYVNGTVFPWTQTAGCGGPSQSIRDPNTDQYSYGASISDSFYDGNLDTIKNWEDALSASQILNLYNCNDNATCDFGVNITGVSYNGFVEESGENYTRQLFYNVSYECSDATTTQYLRRMVNGTFSTTVEPGELCATYCEPILTCDNTTRMIEGNYTHTLEGEYNLSFEIVGIYGSPVYAANANQSFQSDLESPSANASWSFDNGFFNGNATVNLTCSDNIFPTLTYNMSVNNINAFFGNLSNNTLQTNSSNVTEGQNNYTGSCADPFSTTTFSLNQVVAQKHLCLIDERTGDPFDTTNITRARVYFDDNSSFHDYHSNNVSCVNLTTTTNNKLRFDLGYSDGATISRYIDTNLVPATVDVCANVEGVTHFEQFIISSTQREAKMLSQFAQCWVGADYTRFAFQDAFLLKAFTIEQPYSLLVSDEDGNEVTLAGLDGSVSATINIDVLEFNSNQFSLNIIADDFRVKKFSDTTMELFYLNLDNDNEALALQIYNEDDNSLVYSQTSFTNNSNFTIYFDFSTITVTNETLFKAVLQRNTTDGQTFTINRYFNTGGDTGVLPSGLAFVIAIGLTFFGLTSTVARTVFSWLGILLMIVSIAIMSFAAPAWYLTLMTAFNAIVMVYIVLIMLQKNSATVS